MARLIRYAAISMFGLLTPIVSSAYTYKGKVVDETGSPLIGATVKSADNGLMTTTDANGEFSLEVEKNAAKFEISYIGFIPETFVLKKDAQRLPRLSLTPDINALEEVVVTATRTPKALKDVPVVTRLISSDDIKKADATNIQDLLTEELPGLEFSYAMSQETSLNMNGFGGKAILFLVDGERLAGQCRFQPSES